MARRAISHIYQRVTLLEQLIRGHPVQPVLLLAELTRDTRATPLCVDAPALVQLLGEPTKFDTMQQESPMEKDDEEEKEGESVKNGGGKAMLDSTDALNSIVGGPRSSFGGYYNDHFQNIDRYGLRCMKTSWMISSAVSEQKALHQAVDCVQRASFTELIGLVERSPRLRQSLGMVLPLFVQQAEGQASVMEASVTKLRQEIDNILQSLGKARDQASCIQDSPRRRPEVGQLQREVEQCISDMLAAKCRLEGEVDAASSSLLKFEIRARLLKEMGPAILGGKLQRAAELQLQWRRAHLHQSGDK